jgi:hypothetical protein
MRIEQAKPIELTALIATTFTWFVLWPILYLFSSSWNALTIIVVIICSGLTLVSDYFVLRKIAEPYEIRRINKFLISIRRCRLPKSDTL